MRKILFLGLLVFSKLLVYAQQTECVNAQKICNLTYNEPYSASGEGINPNEIDPNNSCLPNGELNSHWYKINVAASGQLCFSIIPNIMGWGGYNYNWSLYNLTNAECADIFTDPSLEISCNSSPLVMITGANGLSGATNEPCVNVNTGETYLLYISKHSGTSAPGIQNGFTLDFTNSTANITDPVAEIDTVISECGSPYVDIIFTEKVKCAKLSSIPFDVTRVINNQPLVLVGTHFNAQNSHRCPTGNAYTDTFTVNLSPEIISGDSIDFCINNVSPSYRLLDECDQPLPISCYRYARPSPIVVSRDTTVCLGQSVVLTASGGDSYTWNDGYNNLGNTPSITVNPAITTTYSVTGNYNSGCSFLNNITVTVLSFTPPNVVVLSNSPVCENAVLNLSEVGGNISGNWSWTGPNGYNSIAQNPIINNILPSSAGIYQVSFTDNNGCTEIDDINVTVNSSPLVSASSNGPVCEGITLNLSEVGGVLTGNYSWTGPNGFSSGLQNASINNVPTSATGTYTVSGTDANGCQGSDNVNVLINAAPIVNATSNEPICEGETLSLNETGGALTGNFGWTGPNGFSSSQLSSSITNAVINASGTYTVSGTDVNGCQGSDNIDVRINSNPLVTIATNSPLCNGGTLNLFETAGNIINWSWTGPNNYNVTGTSMPLINNVTPASAGTYSVSGTDANGCLGSDDVSVVINDCVQALFTVSSATICEGNCINFNDITLGGVPTVWRWYFWDATGFNPVSPITTQNPANICYATAGTYNVALYVSNGVTEDSLYLANFITVNPSGTAQVAANQSICSGDPVNIVATSPASGTWSGPGTIQNTIAPNTNVTGLSSGATHPFTWTPTDACISSATTQITINNLPTVTAVSNTPVCSGNTLTLNETGGDLTGNFTWTGPNGFTSNQQNTTITNVTTVASGVYTISGTDVNGCPGSSNANVTVNNCLVAGFNSSSTNICEGECIDFTDLTLGGTPTIYRWYFWVATGFNPITPITTQNPTNICYVTAGTYNVALFVSNGASKDSLYLPNFITVNSAVNSNAGPDQEICQGQVLQLQVLSQLVGSWVGPGVGEVISNANISNPTVTNLPVGVHNFTWNPTGSCINSDVVQVTVNANGVSDAGTDQVLCFGDPVNLLAITPTSGVWSGPGLINTPNTNTTSVSSLGAATHTFTWTPTNTCITSSTIDVTINPLPNVGAGSDQTICLGDAVVLTGSGANSYNWDNGVTDGNPFSPATTITYEVEGTDLNGCVNNDQVTVTVNSLPTVVANASSTSICPGEAVTLSGSGASTYTWDNGLGTGQNFVVNPTVTTTYNVIGTDLNGCENTSNVTVTVNPSPTVNAGLDQIICLGDAVTLSGSGASSYSWDNGVTDGVAFNPTVTTTYTVTGTSGVGCDGIDQVTITVNSLPNVGAGADQTICLGDAVVLTGSGANSYNWDNGVTDGNPFSPTTTITYEVEGTDLNGCVNNDQVTVTVNSLPTVVANASSTSICPSEAVTLSGSGASTYVWDNGLGTGQNFVVNPTVTTTYNVIGTDLNGCENTSNVTVTVNPNPTVYGGPNQTICLGETVTLTGSGAVNYTWNNGVVDGVPFTPLVTTTYKVTGTNGVGCDGIDFVRVVVDPLPNVGAGTDQTICLGDAVVLTGSGANSYNWDNGVTDGNPFSPSATNTYTVTGTDMNGCMNTDQVIINVNSLPTVIANASSTSICPGESVTLSGSGANTYSWDNGLGTGQSFVVPPTISTTYNVTGIDLNGCENTSSVTITVNPSPTVNGGLDQIICLGDAVTLSGSGASSYSWDNGVTDGVAFNPTATTTYTVTGTSGVGCDGVDQVIVTVNSLPVVATNSNSPICEGTSLNLNETGGDATMWSWSGPNSYTSTNQNPVITNVPLSGAGIYTVTGTDANGCTNSDQVNVSVNALPSVIANASSTSICPGESVTMSGSGANTYSWDNGLGTGQSFVVTPTSATTYTVTGTDVNGCINTDMVTVTINPGPIVTANASSTSICLGESVTLTGSGATSYNWDNNVIDGVAFMPLSTTTYTVLGTDGNGCDGTDQITVIVNPLPVISAGTDQSVCNGHSITLAGTGSSYPYVWDNGVIDGLPFIPLATNTYTVSVTDVNNCIGTDQVVLTVNPLPIINTTSNSPICEGDNINLSETGGDASQWLWYGPNNFSSNLQTPVITNAAATTSGQYKVIGTGIAGCKDSSYVTVTINALPAIIVNSNSPICEGEDINLSETGGDAIAWNWTGPNGFTSSLAIAAVSSATTNTAGIYTVTGTDGNGCNNTANANVAVGENPVLSIQSTTDVSCFEGNDGTITIAVAGNLPLNHYSFLWNDPNNQVTATASNLKAGTYSCTVTNINTSCSTTISATITEPLQMTINIDNITNVSCNGGNDGSTTVSVNGGTMPVLTYSWMPTGQSGSTANNLVAGNHKVYVTDAMGCIDSVDITISEPQALIANASASIHASCNGFNDGIATVSVSGGTMPVQSYLWTLSNQSTAIATGLPAGIQMVTVTDANNCTATDTTLITEPDSITMNLDSLADVNCYGDTDGYIEVSGTGGTPPYSYIWTPNISNTNVAQNLSVGNYSVAVTDSRGCPGVTNNYTISADHQLLLSFTIDSTTCNRQDGVATVAVTGTGTGPYTYLWSDPYSQNTATADSLYEGLYTVVVIDANGCTEASDTIVGNIPGPIIDSIMTTSVSCYGGNDGTATAYSSGRNPFTYQWNDPFNQTTQTAVTLPASPPWYRVLVTDVNGCIVEDSIAVYQPTQLVVSINASDTICYGETITLTGNVTGGTSPYNYLWNPMGSTASGSIIDMPLSSQNYILTITDSSPIGCQKTDTHRVIVRTPLSIVVNNQNICEGDTAILQASSSGGINNYSHFWHVYDGINFLPTTSVNPINPINLYPEDTANYMVYVSDGCSTNDTAYFSVNVMDTATITLLADPLEGCQPLVVKFEAQSDIGQQFEWDYESDGVIDRITSSDTNTYIYKYDGGYIPSISAITINGCKTTYTLPDIITVFPLPQADFIYDPEEITLLNSVISFTDLSSEVNTWYWNFGDGGYDTIQYPIYTYNDTGSYRVGLTITDLKGCINTAYKDVVINPEFILHVPDIFSPNNDGLNDVFKPKGIGLNAEDYLFRVYDRWGELLFETMEIDDAWDGTYKGNPVQKGVYLWKVQVRDLMYGQYNYEGKITLIR